MVNGKTGSGFSWADEVEKEEEEEAQALLQQQKKKPNPFGSARPREIVLQERGIDWRNLDHQLQSSSLRNEKNRSKPITQVATAVESKDQFSVIKFFEQNNRQIQNARNIHDQIVQSPSFLYQKKQNKAPPVPPLCYPPKNVLYVMEEMQSFHNSKNIGRAKPQYERHLRELDQDQEDNINVHMGRNFDAEEQMWNCGNMEILITPNRGGEKENLESRFGRNHVGKRLISLSEERLSKRGRQVSLNREMEKGKGNVRDRRVQSASKGGKQRNVEGKIARRQEQVSLNGGMEPVYLQGDIRDQQVQSVIRKGGNQRNVEVELGRKGHFDLNTGAAYFGGNYERAGRTFWDMECELMSPIQERLPYKQRLQE